jgi:hypothetical protein
MSDGWQQLIKEAVKLPALLADIYGDLLKPGIRQVGKALETVLGFGNTVLWPLALVNEKARLVLKRNLNKFRDQLKDIPEELIVPVPPELGVPIAERLSYVADEELSALYVNLLAKASTVETSNFAHPSFVNIISCLCPDEAVFLRELYKLDPVPFLAVWLKDKGKSGFLPVGDLHTGIEKEKDIKLLFPNNAQAYVSNFEGLGLIHVRRDIFLSDMARYEALEKMYRPQYEALSFDPKKKALTFMQGKIDITPYGKLFMEACLTRLKGS